jgi:transposase
LLADALGRPLRFILTPGQAGDITKAPDLLDGCTAENVIADKAYDSAALRQTIVDLGATPVIPSLSTRKHQPAYDKAIYKLRNRIERCFNKLKHFRRFATRFDRRAIHFLAFIHIAAAMIWMR